MFLNQNLNNNNSQYKSIDTYKPSGNIYDNNSLMKMENKFK